LKKDTIDQQMTDPIPRIEKTQEQYDAFIVAQVRERVRQNPTLMHAEVRDLEIDDLVQRVRIKFWLALQEKEIIYPKAYIRRIVHSEIVDRIRRQKPVLHLLEDQEGEIYCGEVLVSLGEEMTDPAYVVEQQEEVTSRMEEVVGAILKLPLYQRHVMICTLRDRVDDALLLADAFRQHGCDLRQWQWPQMRREKVLLQASLSSARHSIARSIKDGPALQNTFLPRIRGTRTLQSLQPAVEKERRIMEREDTENKRNGESDEEVRDAVTIAEIETYIEKLQDPYRRAVMLHYFEKLNYHEIAARLDLPLGTVKSHVSRGMKMLRKYSEQQEIENQHAMNTKRGLDGVEETAKIAAFLDKLQEPYRRAVALHHLEKLSYPEIAAQLDLPVGTVKSHVSRGMKIILDP
jgi:RNA polymerase sigma factor (sigma-70 family)